MEQLENNDRIIDDLRDRLRSLEIFYAKAQLRGGRRRFRGQQVDMIIREYQRQHGDWDTFYQHLDAEISIIHQQSNDEIIEDWEVCDQLFACPYHAILSDILISLRIEAYTYEDILIPILRYRYRFGNNI